MELILIRHAITQGNLERRFIGTSDVPIVPAGEVLARAVAPALPEIDHLYRSPMVRCAQTAALLWPRHTDHTVIDDFRETDFGPFEGKNHAELAGDPLYERWLAAEDPDALHLTESRRSCADRAIRGLHILLAHAKEKGYGRVAALGHGGTWMALLAALGRPERSYYEWMPPNCGGFLLSVREEPSLRLDLLRPIGNDKL